MRNVKEHVTLAILLGLVVSVSVLAATFFEDFSAMPVGSCYPDGRIVGMWQFVYNGYGCNAFVSTNSNIMLFERPMTATNASETHATLVVGLPLGGDFTLQAWTATTRQLRTGSAPNPWEVAWVLWHYTDNAHFYYFIVKPNGWELGKRDPAYPYGQRFLATGSAPTFPIGQWYRIGVEQSGEVMRISVNDAPLVTFADYQRPYTSGRVGLYSEDAEAYFDNISISTNSKGNGKKK